MQIGPYTIIHHTETVKPESFVVFWQRNGRTERALHVGKRGGFRSLAQAEAEVTKLVRFGSSNV